MRVKDRLVWLTLGLGCLSAAGFEAAAQTDDFRYSWDGETSADVTDSSNWFNKDLGGNPPVSGGDPPVPDASTDTFIGEVDPSTPGYSDPVINSGESLTTWELHLGREFDGALTLNPGGNLLIAFERFRIGNNRTPTPGGNGMVGAGTFVMNGGFMRVGDGVAPRDDVTMGEGSHGTWIMNDGVVEIDDGFLIDVDESNDDDVANSQSYFEMNGGTITTGANGGAPDRGSWQLAGSSSALINGGTINVGKNMELRLESELTMKGGFIGIPEGFLRVQDTTLVEATLNLDGGVIRARNYDITQPFLGQLNINGNGVLQLDLNTESQMNFLISSGDITTSSSDGLIVTTVNIDGNDYTQIAVNAPLPGDYDRDGVVDTDDYNLWKMQLGGAVAALGDGADGNRDGVVDSADYVFWRDNLPASSTAVPEPASLALLIVGACAISGTARSGKERRS